MEADLHVKKAPIGW